MKLTRTNYDYTGSLCIFMPMSDLNRLTKVSRQLEVSMGGAMEVVDVFAVIMFMILEMRKIRKVPMDTSLKILE